MNNPFKKSTLVLSRKDPASMTMLKRLKKRQNFDNIEENSGYSKLQSKNMTVIVLDEEMIYCDNIEDSILSTCCDNIECVRNKFIQIVRNQH